MKFFAKFLTAAAIMAASTFAHATTLSGTINMSSSDSYTDTITSTGITFNPSGTGAERVRGGTGDFATLGNDAVTLPNTITFASISKATPYQLFTFTDAGTNVYSFNATSYVANSNGTAYQFYGLLLLNGNVVNTSSMFNFSNSNVFSLQTTDTFSSTNPNPSATPEPNSLILLGTGLISAAGMVMRKRRTLA